MQAEIILGYRWALGALVLFLMFMGTGPMRRTIIVLLLSQIIALEPWLPWPTIGWSVLMIAADALACLAITWHPAGKWQGVIGLTYLIQITIHIGRIVRAQDTDLNSYWWGLALVAIVQLFLVGGWWLHARVGNHRSRRTTPPKAVVASAKGASG